MQWLMKKLNNTDLFPMAKFWLLWVRLGSDVQFNHDVCNVSNVEP